MVDGAPLWPPCMKHRQSTHSTEPAWVRRLLIGIAFLFLGAVLFVPLLAVFVEALRKGLGVYVTGILDPAALSALRLTVLAAAIALPANAIFGLSAAWAIAR